MSRKEWVNPTSEESCKKDEVDSALFIERTTEMLDTHKEYSDREWYIVACRENKKLKELLTAKTNRRAALKESQKLEATR